MHKPFASVFVPASHNANKILSFLYGSWTVGISEALWDFWKYCFRERPVIQWVLNPSHTREVLLWGGGWVGQRDGLASASDLGEKTSNLQAALFIWTNGCSLAWLQMLYMVLLFTSGFPICYLF